MPMLSRKGFSLRRAARLGLSWMGCALLMLPLAVRAAAPEKPEPMRVLTIGGGPKPEYNQVAIESNVRYLNRLLPADWKRTTLFADGDPKQATVLYEEEVKELPPGEKTLGLLLRGPEGAYATRLRYRRPDLKGALDGASQRADVEQVFSRLAEEGANTEKPTPVLLYFTGHGSNDRRDYENNQFDLWNERSGLTVRDLAQKVAQLPANIPVTLVMVQCYSGSFANLLFEGGDPKAEVVARDIAGFFAAIKERPAAGCTPAVNEAEYHDFTSYFFAALTGTDRVGRRVTGTDFNQDGRVGMDEAFCYTLIHDDSIDVPVATSDIYLRRFVPADYKQTFSTPYRRVRLWATPAQKAALDALSEKLNLTGDDRLSAAYDAFRNNARRNESKRNLQNAFTRFESARREGRQTLFSRWPELERLNAPAFGDARREAVPMLAEQERAGRWSSLLNAHKKLEEAREADYQQELEETRLIRFVRLCNSVVLAHTLQESGEPERKARFARLIAAESRTLLPPVATLARK